MIDMAIEDGATDLSKGSEGKHKKNDPSRDPKQWVLKIYGKNTGKMFLFVFGYRGTIFN